MLSQNDHTNSPSEPAPSKLTNDSIIISNQADESLDLVVESSSTNEPSTENAAENEPSCMGDDTQLIDLTGDVNKMADGLDALVVEDSSANSESVVT